MQNEKTGLVTSYQKRNYQNHSAKPACNLCKGHHGGIFQCQKFKDMNVQEKNKTIRELKICKNCLLHSVNIRCHSEKRCNKCNGFHHTILHLEKRTENDKKKRPSEQATTPHSFMSKTSVQSNNNDVLLATAVVNAVNQFGTNETLRMMIDTGSQTSFITEEAAQRLRLPRHRIMATINGIGNLENQTSKSKVEVTLYPRFPSQFILVHEFLVLPKITPTLPRFQVQGINEDNWKNEYIADPRFNKPAAIDILLGADAVSKIMCSGIKREEGGLLAQQTEFGWIFSGLAKRHDDTQEIRVISMVSRVEEDEQLSKFWQIEEVPEQRILSEEEKTCEAHYKDNTTRSSDGTYTVRLPFKTDPTELGESKPRAIARLLQQEKSFKKNPTLKKDYVSFMEEYISLGHMALVPKEAINKQSFYIPHHAIYKEDSTTTKLRVVFDGSCKSSNGTSLNQIMYTGPRMQADILDILLRWRIHPVVFKADIAKMYRQIKVHKDDQEFQRILWRASEEEPIREYRLTTVTYGTSSAPYLAIKTLHTLADEEADNFTRAAEIIREDTFVDDVLSGEETLEKAIREQDNLIAMLKKGGFTLRKWSSNKQELVARLPEAYQDQTDLEIEKQGTTKSLGIHWKPREDVFTFRVKIGTLKIATKRKILSEIAKLYDPLGWLAPVTIVAKLLIQELWINNLDWDKPVPEHMNNSWSKFQRGLKDVEEIQIPRWIEYNKDWNHTTIELHGFSDASEKAYGAVIYSRVVEQSGTIHITLLTAKSKVAPIKMKKTLPRLELCAASLLASLMRQVVKSTNLDNVPTFAWCDSMITLAWINGDPSRWKNFVANRVATINKELPKQWWNYVKTEENPADLISRGISPDQLKNNSLWWQGPKWLKELKLNTAQTIVVDDTTEEVRRSSTSSNVGVKGPTEPLLIERFSSLTRSSRVIAYCKRFVDIALKRQKDKGRLTVDEIKEATHTILKETQLRYFSTEIKLLEEKQSLQPSNKLMSLGPFIDENGIIRVGGRLKHSELSYNEKHPVIIPKGSHLSTLILRNCHMETLHGGNQLTLAHCRRKYWIVGAKQQIRTLIHKCTTCRRYQNEPTTQIMGDLPKERVTPLPPFTHTGVDYAGPIHIRVSKGRGNKSYKGYIAIFVCLSTKAVHIEVVSDMTAAAFLAAFRRFIARRGSCSHIYSDNGTTFVKASKWIVKEAKNIESTEQVQNTVTTYGTKWHFIPPAAPHFGGIWESAVKSMKHHLKRVLGNHTLTYEELATLTQQIEACLNSRPLWSLSTNPHEPEALTPGHLLVGRPLLTPVDPISSKLTIKEDATTRWNLIQKMKQDFWKSWSSDYLHTLQQRNKWKSIQPNITIGDVVLIKEDNICPGKWPLARVTDTHPSEDGTVRVVTVQPANARSQKRPITKLICLERDEKDPQPIQKKRATTSAVVRTNYWTAPWLTLLTICVIICQPIQAGITNHKAEPGIYVEHRGEAQVNRGTLRLKMEYARQIMIQEEANVTMVIKKVQHLCELAKDLSDRMECTDLVHHLEEQNKQFIWTMKGLNGTTKKLRKRGLLGKLLTSVFGVNDEVYQDIDTLNKNQENLMRASNHQTRLMVETLAMVNETQQKVQHQLEHFNKKINEAIDAINGMSSWYSRVDDNKLEIHIMKSYQIASNYIQELQNFYDKLLDVHFGRGHIYELLPPAQITDLIEKAAAKLPGGLKILQSPITKIYMESNNTMITIYSHFLIVEIEKFEIINVTPVPLTISNTTYSIMRMSSDTLAVDYNTQLYFTMREEEFKDCLSTGNYTYVCAPAVIKHFQTNPNCIIDHLYNRFNGQTCPIVIEKFKGIIWKQLFTPNTWMYIVNHPTPVSVTCRGVREEAVINATGIIQLSQDCILETKQNILLPKYMDTVPVSSIAFKPITIHNISGYHTSDIPKQLDRETVMQVTSNLRREQDEINKDEELSAQVWRKIHHRSSLISAGITLPIIVLFVLGWLSIKYCNPSQWFYTGCCRRSTNPETSNEETNPTTEVTYALPMTSRTPQAAMRMTSLRPGPICSEEQI